MATFSTAPTPFDQVSKEEMNDWLGHPVTNKMLVSLKQTNSDVDGYIIGQSCVRADEDVGAFTKTLLFQRRAREQLIEWIQGAHRE